jgi:phosphopantetheine--protein transferase-like protein
MQDAKLIIAHFLKIQPSEIVDTTKMDASATGGSLILLRMYSKLAGSGYVVENPTSISTFGEFSKAVEKLMDKASVDQVTTVAAKVVGYSDEFINNEISIGIDIEDIANLPNTDNFSTEQFYIDNFSANEIGYCAAKINPLESFAALFSLKESIIKADNSLIKTQFNQIKIEHTKQGRPKFESFYLSTSHSENLVVSVAIKKQNSQKSISSPQEESSNNASKKMHDRDRKNNYFTKTQTFFILVIITAPIYIISFIQYT